MPVETLKCPNCGAPLEGISEIMRCPYCSTTVHVQLNQGGKNAVVPTSTATKKGPPAANPPLEKPAMPPISAEETNQMAATLANLCRQGQKIQAIKLYRERTGEGLLDSKNAVEGLAQGLSLPEVVEKLRVGIKPTVKAGLSADAIADYIRGLIQNGEKDEAIRWYRDRMGISWAEAKNVVDRIASEKPWGPRRKG